MGRRCWLWGEVLAYVNGGNSSSDRDLEVGPGQFWAVIDFGVYGYARHAGGQGGRHAGAGVLEGEDVLRGDTQGLGGFEVGFGRWLEQGYCVGVDQALERAGHLEGSHSVSSVDGVG